MTTRKLCGPIPQGEVEEITYAFYTTVWGSSPSNPVVKVYDITDGTREDVSDVVLSGTSSINGDLITLPKVKSLTPGKIYRIEVQFSAEGDVFETYFDIHAEY